MSFIPPLIWDDERFAELGDEAARVWFFLLTSQQPLPGLIVSGVAAIAEAIRRTVEYTEVGLEELCSAGMVELDLKRRVIRVPNAPKYNPPSNGNIIKGWCRKWKGIPESPLKYRHLKSLKIACYERSEAHAECWDQTFGTLTVKEETDTETLSKPFQNHSQTVYQTVSKPTYTDIETDTETVTGSETETDPDIKAKSVPRFDFETPYKAYPRHEGKAEGMASAKKKIKTAERYEAFCRAVENYRCLVESEARDSKHILLWSTFVNGRWEDYENISTLTQKPKAFSAADTAQMAMDLKRQGL